MKKIFVIFFLIFWLLSCGESDDWLINFSWENFSLRIPNNWEIIDNKDNSIPLPSTWKVEFAIRTKTESNWFLNNLIILSEEQKNKISAEEYVSSSNLVSEKDFFEYKKIEEKEISFKDWNSSKLIIFEARYNNQTPKVNFLQTANICSDGKAYHLTLALEKTISDFSRYEYMLSNFNCKK